MMELGVWTSETLSWITWIGKKTNNVEEKHLKRFLLTFCETRET